MRDFNIYQELVSQANEVKSDNDELMNERKPLNLTDEGIEAAAIGDESDSSTWSIV